jgi:hypothetical protein
VASSAEWFRIYDSSPVADVEMTARYRKETSDDGGRTWEFPRESTGEHLRLDMTESLAAEHSVEQRDGVVTFPSPHPIGGLIRYTPIG